MDKLKAEQFVRRICAKTMDGALRWQRMSTMGLFQTIFSSYILQFGFFQTHDGDFYQMQLFDGDGDLLDSYRDDDFGRTASLDSMQEVMKEAYDVARRSALGVEKAIDDILEELN